VQDGVLREIVAVSGHGLDGCPPRLRVGACHHLEGRGHEDLPVDAGFELDCRGGCLLG
jgi:hypothetical protein